MKTVNIRWVLAHEPIDLFLRAGRLFSDEVKAKSKGRLTVEVMTVSEYATRYHKGPVSRHELLKFMQDGRIEMSQMYTSVLSRLHHDIAALDLPFLFRDHAHAADVLDGPVGQGLLAGLAKKSNIQGLAFTYSGGFRMIASTSPIQKLEDFRGLRIRTAPSDVAKATFKAVEAVAVPMELEELNPALNSGDLNGGESTYPRFYSMKQNEVSPVINDTEHSLFLTSILVNKTFWDGLPEDLRQILTDAAQMAAHEERLESVHDIANIQNRCREDGISIVKLSAAERQKFKDATRVVYTEFEKTFSPGLVRKIQDT